MIIIGVDPTPRIKKKYRHFHTREYRRKHPNISQYKHRMLNMKNRERKQQLREDVLRHYSPELKCSRCGFTDIRALSMDHIYGSGNIHRAMVGTDIYRWLKKNKYPVGFQVLCLNCQRIKCHENNEFRAIGRPHREIENISGMYRRREVDTNVT